MAKSTNRKARVDPRKQAASNWEFESEAQRDSMLEPITEKNCGRKLRLIREVSGMSRRDLARIVGVAETTIYRLETGKTLPTVDFMLRLSALVAIGHASYKSMTDSQKEKISEYIGMAGGVTAGVGGAIGAISAAGAVAGFSAAGITSGLAAIGGGMLGGIGVVAAVPVAAGFAGFGLVKGIKAICEANNLNCKKVEDRWELVPKDMTNEDSTDRA